MQAAEVSTEGSARSSDQVDVDLILEKLLEEAALLVDFEEGAIFLGEQDGPEVTRGGGIEPAVLERLQQEGGTQRVDTGEGVDREWLTVPLVTEEARLGVMYLAANGSASFDSAEKMQRLEALATRAALRLENVHLAAEVEETQEQLVQRTRQLIFSQEQERKRLARALHDGPGQTLTALLLGLGLMEDDPTAVSEYIGEMSELLEEAVDQLQGIVQDLKPPVLEGKTLTEVIRRLCRDFAKEKALSISCRGDELSPVSEEVALLVYRFVREALRNVTRHAEANEVQVTMARDDKQIEVQVADDGRGFDWEILARDEERYSGLQELRYRLALVGGSLTIDARPGEGVVLTATLLL